MAIALVSSLLSVTLSAAPSDAALAQTLENLQTALNGERNPHLRYLAFAEKADQEGDGAVASLFRAAAAAEAVHGDNHEQVIRQLGGTPNLRRDTPVVKSTRENLEAAINGESYEHQKMYPEFIGPAPKDAYVPAIVRPTQAKKTEQEHARLFSEALNNLDRLKGSQARTHTTHKEKGQRFRAALCCCPR